MSPDDIRSQLRVRPFHPIRLFLTDGTTFDVRHPEMMMVSRTQVIVGIAPRGKEIFDRFAYCDPLHIVRIEPLNGSHKAPRRPKRK